MSHLRRLPEMNPDYFNFYALRFARALERGAKRQADERRRLRSLVTMILEAGGHGALNFALKAAALEGERPHTLAGIHDVDAFLFHVQAQDRGCPLDPRWGNIIETTARTVGDGTRSHQRPSRSRNRL